MSRLRKQQKTNYAHIDNEILQDNRLSFRARGIAAYLLSKPNDWTITVLGMAKAKEPKGKRPSVQPLRNWHNMGIFGANDSETKEAICKPLQSSQTIRPLSQKVTRCHVFLVITELAKTDSSVIGRSLKEKRKNKETTLEISKCKYLPPVQSLTQRDLIASVRGVQSSQHKGEQR